MSKQRRVKSAREGLTQGEARIYRKNLWPHNYTVRLSRDLFGPFMAEALDAGAHVSLDGAGETARYSPPTLALPGGALSLQTVTLTIGPETAQTSDGVLVKVSAIIEFHIIESRAMIAGMVKDGKFKTLGAVFANRCRAAIASEIGRMHYGEAIEHQGDNCSSMKNALNRSVNDVVNTRADGLGIEVTSANLRVEAKHELGESGDAGSGRADFDLPNKARRILRFLREHQPTAAELVWIERQIDRLIDLESRRVVASGKATIVLVDGAGRELAEMNAADFMALAQSGRADDVIAPAQPQALQDTAETVH